MQFDMRKIFECPICTDIVTLPIFMCINGHSYCNSCIPELVICPICGQAMMKDCNILVDKMLQKIRLPCRNTHKGCNVFDLVLQVKEHENCCNYSLVECPRKGCTWIGTVRDVEEHCRLIHIEAMGNMNNLECFPMHCIFNPNLVYGFLLRFSGQIFVFRYGLDKTINCIKYCAASMNLNCMREFYFVVRFVSKTNNTQYYEFKCPCSPLNVGWRSNFEELPASALLHFDLVKDFLDETTKSFVCTIEVLDKSNECW